jgi:hypothetical protein
VPLTISDPSLNPGVVNQDTSIFDWPDTPAQSLMSLQGSPSQPLADRTATGTNLLFPDLLLEKRLANFPGAVWNVTPSSFIYRLMAALMGPAGAGQLRQRQQISHLQSAVAGTHFYDLDSFYGALFSAQRGPGATFPQNPSTGTTFNPYTDLATQDGWDSINAIDAVYRERIIQLARAIALGGTLPGLQAIAEAILQVPCDIYEVWKLIDYQGPESSGTNTWTSVEASYPLWSSFGPLLTWAALENAVIYGGMGINARAEVIIEPRQAYGSDLASQQQAASDAQAVSAVADVLAPASCLLTVNTGGVLADTPIAIAALSSDSDYWEISQRVQAPAGSAVYAGYASAYDPGGPQPQSQPMAPGAPPFSQSQGARWSAVGSVASSVGFAFTPTPSSTSVLTAAKQNNSDYEVVRFPNGKSVSYVPSWGVSDAATVSAGRVAAVGTVAAPYSGPRVPVVTAG